MKTAISIPDDVFDAAERLASRHGLSRSELYAMAVADWVARHRDDQVTEALNAVYGDEDAAGVPDAVIQSLQVRSLRGRQRK